MNYTQRDKLAFDIDCAINNIKWPHTYQEPDYVAKLVTTLPAVIQSSLNSLFVKGTIAVGGVFIHQKPLAHFINKPGWRNPELGDLLIVCREQRASGVCYNAMLLQAKCVDNILKATIPNDHQFLLYSKWPKFEYVRAGCLNGVRRNVHPKTITQGAQYLLIDKKNPFVMYTATVERPLNGITCLPCTISSIIAFDSGRTFQVEYPRDQWSLMILDLLRMSANAVFNRRRQGFIRKTRWIGDSAFNYLLKAGTTDGFVVDNDGDEDGTPSGISVLCIDLGKEQQE